MTENIKSLVQTLNETDNPNSNQLAELIDMFAQGDEAASRAMVKEAEEVISCIFDADTIRKMDGTLVDHDVAALMQFSKVVKNYEAIGMYQVQLDKSELLIQVMEVTMKDNRCIHFANILQRPITNEEEKERQNHGKAN
ncbi:hypothetical protein [Clostridium porci]|uniref:Uncharacterized protein n=1 Tax=Clostridium porci TaxID=2605778 RepID=A0A7X2NND6_9CLOT|nr:hypothetical protein [Clostridium porci]MSS38037.1 hypothetical protein [Clostridium porci]